MATFRLSNSLLRVYRSLMPRDDSFIERLSQHAHLIVPATVEFRALMSGDGKAEEHAAEIGRLEEVADEITRKTVVAIHRTFVTPFDRSQILDLITALDDTIDLMKETGRRMLRYGVAFTPEMQGMADCAVRAATEIRDAIPLLGSIDRNAARLSTMSIAVRRIEGEADELLTVEKVYDLVEAVVDRCEDVVDVIVGIVVEQI